MSKKCVCQGCGSVHVDFRKDSQHSVQVIERLRAILAQVTETKRADIDESTVQHLMEIVNNFDLKQRIDGICEKAGN